MSREPVSPGLCGQCRHCHRITTARHSTFYRCQRADTDQRFPRYPRLPVVACPGFEPTPPPARQRR